MATSDPLQRPVGQPGVQPVAPILSAPLPPGQPAPGAWAVPSGQYPAQAQPVAPVSAARPAVQPVAQQAAGAQRAAVARPVKVAGKPGGTVVRTADRQAQEEERDATEAVVRRAPPWLVSTVVHMAMLIIMGLILVATGGDGKDKISLEVPPPIYAEELGEQLELDSPFGVDKDAPVEESVLTPDDLPEVPDPFAAPAAMDIVNDGNTAASDLNAAQIGMALTGRQPGTKRSRLMDRYGGTALTEEAVRRGLDWLARNQQRDGSWSLSGPYSDGVDRSADNWEAATAMALLAFQGHGDTHKDGAYKNNVANGWKWLAKQQDEDGNFFHSGPHNHRYYTQGQCAIAACELYGMTQDPKFKTIAEKAVDNLVKAQAPEGGWRYSPNTDSDVSVTGWIVMALQSAKMAKLEVPEETFKRVERFLDRVGEQDGSRYPYQQGGRVTPAMTAEALLCRQYLGWARKDERLVSGVDWITSPENLISFTPERRNVYYWYYATQVVHHMEGDHWKRWNAIMRQVMPEQQVQRGKEAGSWDPNRPCEDKWAVNGGRLYVTCLSIYMLQVYYRHLPIYTNVYSDLFQSGRAPGL